jgi:hypothetical protein
MMLAQVVISILMRVANSSGVLPTGSALLHPGQVQNLDDFAIEQSDDLVVHAGRWLTIAWNPQRLLAAFATQFIDELVAFCRRDYPGRSFIRHAPPLPQPKQ